MTRRDQIVELLHLRGQLAPSSPNAMRGSGQATPLLPHDRHCAMHRTAPPRCTCWIASLGEITKALVELRSQERTLWYHCFERYVAAERRPRNVTVKNRHPQLEKNQRLIGLLSTHDLSRNGNGTARVLVESWSVHADQLKALRGVDWIDQHTDALLQLPADGLAA